MQFDTRAATEVAQICCFDPVALPEWFDPESGKAMNRLEKEKLAWVFDTGSEGEYLVRVYVEEPMPEALRKASRGPQVIDRFPVPSGVLRICGSEYCNRPEDVERACRLKPGSYRLAAWLVDEESYALEQLGLERPAWVNAFGPLVTILAFFCTVAFLALAKGASLASFLSGRPMYALLAGVVAWLLVYQLHRRRTRLTRNPGVEELTARTPALVLEMRFEGSQPR